MAPDSLTIAPVTRGPREGVEIRYGTAGDSIFLPEILSLARADLDFA